VIKTTCQCGHIERDWTVENRDEDRNVESCPSCRRRDAYRAQQRRRSKWFPDQYQSRAEYRRAWEHQNCACACGGTPGRGRIWGTVEGRRAMWHECSYCTGTAIGWPLIDP
jgi:hypothetical protein